MTIIVSPSEENIQEAGKILRRGGVVAYPTETYYGLAVDPFNEAALQKLVKVKNRPRNKPISVLINNPAQLDLLVQEIPPLFVKLIKKFWPGPLTLVFPARNTISFLLTGGTGTIGIRQSPHPVAGALLTAFSDPLTATSANRSGDAPATTAAEIIDQFQTDIDMVLDGGETVGRRGSTLVSQAQGKLQLMREGVIKFNDIKAISNLPIQQP